MTERIYIRDEKGALVSKGEAREPGKRYSRKGTDPDGAARLVEWSDAEVAHRAAEEAAYASTKAEEIRNPPPARKPERDEIEELKTRLAALESRAISAKP